MWNQPINLVSALVSHWLGYIQPNFRLVSKSTPRLTNTKCAESKISHSAPQHALGHTQFTKSHFCGYGRGGRQPLPSLPPTLFCFFGRGWFPFSYLFDGRHLPSHYNMHSIVKIIRTDNNEWVSFFIISEIKWKQGNLSYIRRIKKQKK